MALTGRVASLQKITLWLLITAIFSYASLMFWMTPHAKDVSSNRVDVVIVARQPTCVTQTVIQSIFFYIDPPVLYIISKYDESCKHFEAMHNKVRCYPEDSVISNMSLAVLTEYFHTKHKRFLTDDKNPLAARIGWYYQQFLKMAVARHWPHLSDHFLLWDSDMIIINRIKLFYGARVAVQSGGHNIEAYDATYRRLMGRGLEMDNFGGSFTTHHAVVSKHLMNKLLDALSIDGSDDANSWITNIVNNAGNSASALKVGFSEYGTYVSFVRQTAPRTQHVIEYKQWARAPFQVTRFFRLRARYFGWAPCCPRHWMFWYHKYILRQIYVGFEIGHMPMCDIRNAKFAVKYEIQ